MKIWLVTTEFPPFFGGGIGTYCDHTTKMFSQKGDHVTVIIPDTKLQKYRETEDNGGIKLVRFRPGYSEAYKYMSKTVAMNYEIYERIVELLSEYERPDIIELQDYLGIAYFLLHKKRELHEELMNIPVILTLHTPKYLCDEFNQNLTYRLPDYWIGEMERYCMKAADYLISPSMSLVNKLSEGLEFDRHKVTVIPNPYHFDECPVNPDGNEFAFCGNVQYRKGIYQLIKNLTYFWDQGLERPLNIIGYDTIFLPKVQSFKKLLEEKFDKYNKKGLLRFWGMLSQDQIKEKMEKVDVVFVPSIYDNLPYVVIESMAKGKIVMASDNGGQAEIINSGKDGFLFSHKDNETFRQSLSRILNMSRSEKEEMMRNAQRRVKEMFSYDGVYKLKTEILKQVIDNHSVNKEYSFIRDISKKEIVEPVRKSYKEKLLSVVVPYYNMGRWIKDTLNSILNSTYLELEMIIVNDGSDDDESLNTLSEIEKAYPVKIVNKPNGGLSSARNEGAIHANGEYLAFLDSDDMVKPQYYERAVRILKQYSNVSFVGCWMDYCGDSSGKWITWDPEPPFILGHNSINSSSLVYKTQDFINFGLNDEDMVYGMEDYESVIRMVENGCRGVAISEALLDYRVRSDSMSRQFNTYNELYLYRLISEKHKEFFAKYAVELFNILNNNGPSYMGFYASPASVPPMLGFVKR
ncbi:MAG: glycosyltransferase [Clostridia bacterium]|nr:glycosyltransferase [Clostridia bacterium]